MNAFTILATAEETRGSKVRESPNKTSKKEGNKASKTRSKEKRKRKNKKGLV